MEEKPFPSSLNPSRSLLQKGGKAGGVTFPPPLTTILFPSLSVDFLIQWRRNCFFLLLFSLMQRVVDALYYRWSGFLSVVWFGSFPIPRPHSPISKLYLILCLPVCRPASSLLSGDGGEGEERGWSPIIRQRETLVFYNSLTTALADPCFYRRCILLLVWCPACCLRACICACPACLSASMSPCLSFSMLFLSVLSFIVFRQVYVWPVLLLTVRITLCILNIEDLHWKRTMCNKSHRRKSVADFHYNFKPANFRAHTATPFIYSFSGNSAASAPISKFICLWAIYIVPGSVHIFPTAEQADPSWEYINCSQTHECGNWDWGPDIPFLGIFVSNFRHFIFAVHDRVRPD